MDTTTITHDDTEYTITLDGDEFTVSRLSPGLTEQVALGTWDGAFGGDCAADLGDDLWHEIEMALIDLEEDLCDAWDRAAAAGATVYRVMECDGTECTEGEPENRAGAQVLLDGTRWLYVDDLDGYSVIDAADVAAWQGGKLTTTLTRNDGASTMKKAIVQIGTAILGIGDDYEEAMNDARTSFPELTDSDIETPARSAIAGECVCIGITDELAEDAATDNWDVETNELGDMVAVSTRSEL